MPAPGQAQPDVMPFLKMRLDDVVVLEGGLSPSTVITAPATLTLRLDVGFEGMLAGLLTGQPFSVVHHIERIEDGNRINLPGGNFVVPAPPASSHILVNSGVITTGASGSGANLEIAPGFASGTFRVLTHVHADNPAVRPIVAAFHDGLVIQVT